jgi:prepilin-type N-terminal cleavage/methylation domain-containing protein
VDREPKRRVSEQGVTLIELLLVVLIVGLLSALAIPVYSNAIQSAFVGAVIADARDLHGAFMRYHLDAGMFPSTSSPVERALNRQTLEPIAPTYFTQASLFAQKLFENEITLYDSPNVEGPDTQFWAVLVPLADPDMRLLVAHTDRYPGFEGTWFDGVYRIEGGAIVPVD